MRRIVAPLLMLTALALTATALPACSATPRAENLPAEERLVQRNHGYALLYDLVSRQRQLPGILIIKQESQATRELVVEIANFCKDVYQQLNAFAKEDATLGYDLKGLPAIEEAARAAIEDTHRNELLSATVEFELRLMLTQTDGLAYGAHLCKVVAQRESNEHRREKLNQWQQRFEQLREEVVQRLIELDIDRGSSGGSANQQSS